MPDEHAEPELMLTPFRSKAINAVCASRPASAMQVHPTVTIVVDEPAASLLQLRAYYQETYAHKPDWQRF